MPGVAHFAAHFAGPAGDIRPAPPAWPGPARDIPAPPAGAAPVAIVGPTASGKSALALALARRHPGTEIVSVDSMGVYRGMDVGTAKPGPDARAEVAHHLVDLADPSEDFSVQRFQDAALATMADLAARRARPLLVGGTGLYLRAVTDGLTLPRRWPEVASALEEQADAGGQAAAAALHARLRALDPQAASRMEPTNRRRVLRALEVTMGSGRPFSSFGPGLDRYPPTPVRLIGIRLSREVLAERIAARLAAQMEQGWLEEVRRLASRPAQLSRTARQALGYRELLDHLEGRISLAEAMQEAGRRTRRLARRQLAWFGRDPRVRWVDSAPAAMAAAEEAMAPPEDLPSRWPGRARPGTMVLVEDSVLVEDPT